jgi:hypothetical protein
MKNRPITLEHVLYALALAIALVLRFLHLERLPLSDFEADWAMQALGVAGGQHPAIGPNPAYVHLTAILFFVLGSTNFLARFWPALAGSALVLAPWFLRGGGGLPGLGRVPALILAFGLAIDPGLAGLSRLAGSPILAVTLVVFAALMWREGRRAAAGVLAGMALLSGPSVWFGLAGLGLSWVALKAFEPRTPEGAEPKVGGASKSRAPKKGKAPASEPTGRVGMRAALWWAAGTLAAIGSLLLISPLGLSGFIRSLTDFLRGWITVSGIPLWQPLAALPAYEILPLGFAVAAAVRGILWKDAELRRLSIWAVVALLLALAYPAKQMGDLVWAILPLWILAACELGRHLDFERSQAWPVAGLITLVFSLLVFAWLELAALTTVDLSADTERVRWLLVVMIALLIGLALLISGVGWSTGVSRRGGVWGLVLALALYTLAVNTGATGLREPRTFDLWHPEPRASYPALLPKVAGQIAELNGSRGAQLALTITGIDSPALRWQFRDWQVQEVAEIALDAAPELVVTPMGELNLTVEYRGEALALHEVANWDVATRSDWLQWFIYRQIPTTSEDVILWVRSDLMLDSQGVPEPGP